MTQAELNIQSIDLGTVARDVANQLQQNSTRHVTWDIQPDMVVCADPSLLKIVLENMLGNAWKYSAKMDHAQITVRKIDDKDAQAVTIEFADNGARRAASVGPRRAPR